MFPYVLDAPKNEPKSPADDPRKKRSTARRTASVREIFSRRQNNVSFLICSWGKSTIVRTMISSHVIIDNQIARGQIFASFSSLPSVRIRAIPSRPRLLLSDRAVHYGPELEQIRRGELSRSNFLLDALLTQPKHICGLVSGYRRETFEKIFQR